MRRITLVFMLLVAVVASSSALVAKHDQRPENLSVELATEGPQAALLRYAAANETIEAKARTVSVTYSGTLLMVTMADGSATFTHIATGQTVNRPFQRLEFSFEGGSLKRTVLHAR